MGPFGPSTGFKGIRRRIDSTHMGRHRERGSLVAGGSRASLEMSGCKFLYRVATGRPPFAGYDPMEVDCSHTITVVVTATVPPPVTTNVYCNFSRREANTSAVAVSSRFWSCATSGDAASWLTLCVKACSAGDHYVDADAPFPYRVAEETLRARTLPINTHAERRVRPGRGGSVGHRSPRNCEISRHTLRTLTRRGRLLLQFAHDENRGVAVAGRGTDSKAGAKARRNGVLKWTGVVLVLIAILANPLLHLVHVTEAPAFWYLPRTVVVLVGLVLFLQYCRLQSLRAPSGYPHSEQQLDSTDVLRAVYELDHGIRASRFASQMGAESAWDFAEQYVRPWESRSRMTETIEMNGDHFIRSCVLEIQSLSESQDAHALLSSQDTDALLSSQGDRSVRYIPIIRLERGLLVDNFVIRDASGADLPTLPSDDAMLLNGNCIRTLLLVAVDEAKMGSSTSALTDYAQVEAILLAHCVKRYPEANGSALAAMVSSKLPVKSNTHLELLANFVAHVGRTYAIVAQVEILRLEYGVVRYSYTEPVHSGRPPERSLRRRFQSTLRRFFGLDPSEIYVDASRSRKCSSYHLRVQAPSGYYVGLNSFYERESKKIITHLGPRDIQQTSRPYFRCRPPRGQSFAHLYTRGFSASTIDDPYFSVQFDEKLPGSLGKAWMLAVATGSVTWLFGASWITGQAGGAPKVVEGASSFAGVDPGAFIFAVPLALWAITGYGDRKGGYASALYPQVSIAVSMLLSFGALILTLFIKSNRIPANLAWPSVLFVTHPFWIVLVILSLVNVTLVGQRLLIGSWRARRQEEDDTP